MAEPDEIEDDLFADLYVLPQPALVFAKPASWPPGLP